MGNGIEIRSENKRTANGEMLFGCLLPAVLVIGGGLIGCFIFLHNLQDKYQELGVNIWSNSDIFHPYRTGFNGFIIGSVGGFILYMILYVTFTPQEEIDKFKEDHAKNIASLKKHEQQNRINEMLRLGIKCPTCSSNNVERISKAKKAAYVAATGILAPAFKKVRSQFECKNCSYKW